MDKTKSASGPKWRKPSKHQDPNGLSTCNACEIEAIMTRLSLKAAAERRIAYDDDSEMCSWRICRETSLTNLSRKQEVIHIYVALVIGISEIGSGADFSIKNPVCHLLYLVSGSFCVALQLRCRRSFRTWSISLLSFCDNVRPI